MRRICGRVAPWALVAPLLLVGCGGAGDEPNTTGGGNPPLKSGGAPDSASATGKDGEPKGKSVTPERVFDSRGLSKVVEEETAKGGEAQEGPSPAHILWHQADATLIHDEPFTVNVPKGLPPVAPLTPASNPLTKGRVELGKQLYFEPRISLDGTVSCATCHNPAKGWTDKMPVSIGINGQTGDRSAPTVLNTVYGRTMFWDGRAPSLEAQCQGPPQNPIEMGKQTYQDIIERLRKIPAYRAQFQKVFGTDVTLDGVAKAIASFERVAALSGNSKYDKYQAGDVKALSDTEKRGMVLFGLTLDTDDEFKPGVVRQKANCTACHAGFNFTDEQFHNLGIGWDEKKKLFADMGRWKIDPIGAKNDADIGAFKTPTVRDAARTAPYMHDGSLRTLADVIEHYNKGGTPNPFLDKEMKKPLNLSDQEKADVIAFMQALTGEEIPVELPTLPAGPDGKTPDPKSALTPPAKTARNVFHPLIVR